MLIVTPLVNDIISKVKKEVFKSSVYGLVNTAEIESKLIAFDNPSPGSLYFNYKDGIESSNYIKSNNEEAKLNYKGKKMQNGNLIIREDGKIYAAFHNGNWCAVKDYDDNVVEMTQVPLEDCVSEVEYVVFHLKGDSTEYVELNIDEYNEKGAIAKTLDGVILDDVTIKIFLNNSEVSSVDNSKLNTYEIVYSITYVNNIYTISRVVEVRDTTKPEFIISEDIELTISDFSNFDPMIGVSEVTDNSGEDIKIIIETDLKPYPGDYTITYSATDSSGNETVKTRKITVIDDILPKVEFTPNGNDTYAKTRTVKVNVEDEHSDIDVSSLKYVWTTSLEEPNLSEFVNTFNNNEEINTPLNVTGNYYLWISAKDDSGNEVTESSNVFKLDNTKPVITLIGDSSITLNIGDTYTEKGATAADEHSGIVDSVQSTGLVNPNKPGIYEIIYKVSDKAGNKATKTRTVTVVDIEAPVITILGDNPKIVYVDQVYKDEGATAIDDVDGDVTSDITTTGSVNTNDVGTYNITYTVSDSAGNESTKIRTIEVIDNVLPEVEFTPNGNSTYKQSYSVKVKVTDEHSEVDSNSLKYLWKTNTTTPAVSEFTKTFTNNQNIVTPSDVSGDYYLWILAKDTAGNEIITKSNLFKLDNDDLTVMFTPNGSSTYKQSHSVKVEVGAGNSGVDTSSLKYLWKTNIDTPVVSNFTKTFTNNQSIETPSSETGDYYLWIYAKNKAGKEIIYSSKVFKIDNTNPNVVFDTNGNTDHQKSHSSKVSVTDSHSGVSSLKYLWVKGISTPSENSINKTFANEEIINTPSNESGDYYLWILAKDSANNTTITRSNVFKLDNENPNISFSTNGSSTYKQSHSTKVTVSDSKSGVLASSLKYLWNTSTSTPSESSFSTSFVSGSTTINTPDNVSGDYYLWILAKDNAGNIEIKRSDVFKLDNIDLSISFSTNGSSTYKQSHSTKITVGAGNSGVDTSNLKYLWNTSTSTPSASNFSSSFTNGGTINTLSGVTGDYYLWIYAKNNAGKEKIVRSNVFKLDNTNPTVSFGTNGNSTYQKSHSTTVMVSDAHSGIDTSNLKYLWAVEGLTPKNESDFTGTFTNGETLSISGQTLDYYLWVLVKDKAGNETIRRSDVFKLDNTNPSISFGTNGNSTYQKSHSTTVTVSDSHSGVDTNTLKYGWTTSSSAPSESNITTSFNSGSTLNTPSNVTGNYYLWILAKDKVGNSLIKGTSVFKLDNTKPVITLNGNSSMTINKGSSFTDPGATATDAHSGISGSVVATGSVNPNVVGTYQITYTVSDRAGNAATPVVRTITVVDVEAPVITILGNNPVTVYVEQTYTDAGATALDDVDGDVTSSITTTGSINTSVPGTYTITYTVSDSAGNKATAKRTVNVIDNVLPVVSLETNGSSTYKKSHSTKVTVSDAHSSVDPNSLKYLWNTSTRTPSASNFSTSFTNGGTVSSPSGVTGDYYLWIIAKDTAGNTEIKRSSVFKLDNTISTVSFETNGSSAYKQNHSTKVTISDSHSGVEFK